MKESMEKKQERIICNDKRQLQMQNQHILFINNRPDFQKENRLKQVLNNNMKSHYIQRIRIKVDKEESDLMERMQQAVIPNVGNPINPTWDYPSNTNQAEVGKIISEICAVNRIGIDEDIILYGHGNPGWFSTESLGFIFPPDLAKIAFNVPKPDPWNGKIILFGCNTKGISKDVSKEYFKLSGRKTVEVVGINKKITVGAKDDGTFFPGIKWRYFASSEHPTNLDYLEKLFNKVVSFQNVHNEFGFFVKTIKGIALNNSIYNSSLPKFNLSDIKNRSTCLIELTDQAPEYRYAERNIIYTSWIGVLRTLENMSFLLAPINIGQTTIQQNSILPLVRIFDSFTNNAMKDLYPLCLYYYGLLCKEVDFNDKSVTTHHKMSKNVIWKNNV